jgi:hypothetical protein
MAVASSGNGMRGPHAELLWPQAAWRGLSSLPFDTPQHPEHRRDVATQMKELPKDSA